MKYKMPFNEYDRCMKMSKNEFSRWISSFFDTAFQEGYKQAHSDIPEGSIILEPEDNVVINWSYDEFKEVLKSINGIGENKANLIIEKIYEYFDTCNKME